jgi:hypothetical protein
MDRAPGRIGFMSTQRLAGRQPVAQVEAEVLEQTDSVQTGSVQTGSARAAQLETAPPLNAALRATSSLQSDYRISPLEYCSGSPPGEGASAATAILRSSFPPIPSPPVCARFHLALPLIPAALSSRTERYDGKGNLYIQHAA